MSISYPLIWLVSVNLPVLRWYHNTDVQRSRGRIWQYLSDIRDGTGEKNRFTEISSENHRIVSCWLWKRNLIFPSSFLPQLPFWETDHMPGDGEFRSSNSTVQRGGSPLGLSHVFTLLGRYSQAFLLSDVIREDWPAQTQNVIITSQLRGRKMTVILAVTVGDPKGFCEQS